MDGSSPETANFSKENFLTQGHYFTTPLYTSDKPEFLEATKQVTDEHLEFIRQTQKLNEIYPAHMTANIYTDPRMAAFCQFVGEQSWYILYGQGYAMKNLSISIESVWCQEHYKHSLMEQHTHNGVIQIVGFYFIDCPEGSSNIMFHDPRPAKVQISLPEDNQNYITPASNVVGFAPKPGQFFFTNSWLAHSFSRHASDEPIRFIHFNMMVVPTAPIVCPPPAEVVWNIQFGLIRREGCPVGARKSMFGEYLRVQKNIFSRMFKSMCLRSANKMEKIGTFVVLVKW